MPQVPLESGAGFLYSSPFAVFTPEPPPSDALNETTTDPLVLYPLVYVTDPVGAAVSTVNMTDLVTSGSPPFIW